MPANLREAFTFSLDKSFRYPSQVSQATIPVDPIHSDEPREGKGGRSGRTLSPQQLLAAFERHAAAHHRTFRRPATRESFCSAIGRTKPTLKAYLEAYGFGWPLIPPGHFVALSEAEYPNELLWISAAFCAALLYAPQDLLDKPWMRAFRPSEAPDAERLAQLYQIRTGSVEAYDMRDTHYESSDGRWLPAHAQVRYGPESDTFYTVVQPLGELHAPPSLDHEVLNVEPGVRWVMVPVRDGPSRIVHLDSREELLEWLERRRQPDQPGLFDPTIDP